MFSAIVIDKTDSGSQATLRQIDETLLSEGDVVVEVDCSTLNYKDGLALTGRAPIIKTFPMVPGVDFAGTVIESRHPDHRPGDKVLLNGWGVGESHTGGLSQRARVKHEWLMPLPEAFTPAQAMAIGTAGYTAMLSVMALERHGIGPASGDIVVTGAAGGVGSTAVSILARLGYRVLASTGRPQEADYLRELGAAEIIDRRTLDAPGKPLARERWIGAIDTVGSHTLANVCAATRTRGVVTACGLAQGHGPARHRGAFHPAGHQPRRHRERAMPDGRAAGSLAAARPRPRPRPSRAHDDDDRPLGRDPHGQRPACRHGAGPRRRRRQPLTRGNPRVGPTFMSPQPISRFPIPELNDMPDDIRSRIMSVQEKSGFVPNIFLALAHRPDEFRAFFAYHDAVMERDGGLSKADREMIVVATSSANQCLYCVMAHGAILRVRARDPFLADQVATNYRKADITPRQRAMLDFALKVSRKAEAVDDADLATLAAFGFTREDIWDIGAISAFFALSNRFANLVSLRPNDEFSLMGRVPRS